MSNFLILMYIILVTRSQRKFLASKGYNQACRIRIHRIGKLDKLAFSRPKARRLVRTRSAQNLTQISPQNTRQQASSNLAQNSPRNARQRAPIDMAKIRSILKNPIGKPQSIIARRATVPDRPSRITFRLDDDNADDGVDMNVSNVDEIDDSVADLINLSSSSDQENQSDNIATTGSTHADTPSDSHATMRNLIDELDPIQVAFNTSSVSKLSLLQPIDWSTVQPNDPKRALPNLIPLKLANGTAAVPNSATTSTPKAAPKVRTRIVKVIMKKNNQQQMVPMSNVLPRNWTANRILEIVSMNPVASLTSTNRTSPVPSTSTGETAPKNDSLEPLVYDWDSDSN